MSESMWIGIVGFLILIIQGLVAYYVGSINDKIKAVCMENKVSHDDMWKRIYGHYHEVVCSNDDCSRAKTGNVIIPHEVA